MTKYSIGVTRVSAEAPPTPLPPDEPTLLLADYPLGLPVGVSFPDSEEAWEERFGGDSSAAIPLPSAIFACTESTGNDLNNCLGSGELLARSGDPRHQVKAVGLTEVDGAGNVTVHPRRGVELVEAGDLFLADDDDYLKPGTHGLAVLVVYRTFGVPTGASTIGVIAGKKDGPPGNGWLLGINKTGRAVFRARGGAEPGAGGAAASRRSASQGAWHCSLGVLQLDPDVDNSACIHHHCDLGSRNLTLTGSEALKFDSADSLHVGGKSGLLDSARCHVAYLALWQFNAPIPESMIDGSAFRAFWPNQLPGVNQVPSATDELTLRLGGLVDWPVGTDEEGSALVARYYKGLPALPGFPPQYPYTAMGTSTPEDGGYGNVRDLAANLLRFSENLKHIAWKKHKVSPVTPDAAIAPNGMFTATTAVFKTGDPYSFVRQIPVIKGADGKKCVSIWLRLASGVLPEGASVVIGFRGDPVEHPERFKEVSSELVAGRWIRVDHWHEVNAAETALTVAVRASGNVTLDLWGAQLNEGPYPGPYVMTRRVPRFIDGSDLSIDLPEEEPPWQLRDTGRVAFEVRLPYGDAATIDRVLATIHGKAYDDAHPSGNPVEIRLGAELRPEGEAERAFLVLSVRRQDLGGDWATCVSAHPIPIGSELAAEILAVEAAWRFRSGVLRLTVNGVEGAVESPPYDTFSGFRSSRLEIGDDGSGAQPDAMIRKVKVYER